jgi:hypothetical protein
VVCTAHHPFELELLLALKFALAAYGLVALVLAFAVPTFRLRRVWIPFSLVASGAYLIAGTVSYNWSWQCLEMFPTLIDSVVAVLVGTLLLGLVTGGYAALVAWIARRVRTRTVA